MPTNPLVFISYSQKDDEYEGGALHDFRNALSGALQFVSGNKVGIFQEGTDVAIGEPIQERISQSLSEAMVLVPVVTPSFFTDANCRDILSRFLERERQLRRNDLVLAVYYQQVSALEAADARTSDDHLVRNLAQRRMLDWQPLRGKDFKDPQVRRELESLARRIIEILDELAAHPPVPPQADTPAAPPAPPGGPPRQQPTRQLTMPEITQFVNLLLACPSIQDRSIRNDVLAFLPDNVRNAIPRRDQDQADVMSIVRTCNNYPGALQSLIEGIRAFNEGSIPLQAVDAFWNNVS
jgi:hypothetical protein